MTGSRSARPSPRRPLRGCPRKRGLASPDPLRLGHLVLRDEERVERNVVRRATPAGERIGSTCGPSAGSPVAGRRAPIAARPPGMQHEDDARRPRDRVQPPFPSAGASPLSTWRNSQSPDAGSCRSGTSPTCGAMTGRGSAGIPPFAIDASRRAQLPRAALPPRASSDAPRRVRGHVGARPAKAVGIREPDEASMTPLRVSSRPASAGSSYAGHVGRGQRALDLPTSARRSRSAGVRGAERAEIRDLRDARSRDAGGRAAASPARRRRARERRSARARRCPSSRARSAPASRATRAAPGRARARRDEPRRARLEILRAAGGPRAARTTRSRASSGRGVATAAPRAPPPRR